MQLPRVHPLFLLYAVALLPQTSNADSIPRACLAHAADWQKELNSSLSQNTAEDGNKGFYFSNPGKTMGSITDINRLAKPVMILYTLDGTECYRSHLRVKEGDLVHVGIVDTTSNTKDLRGQAVSCKLQTPDVAVYDAFQASDSTNDPLALVDFPNYGLRKFPAVECYGEPFTFEVTNPAGEVIFSKNIRQYPRYRGTFQVGTVITSLGERTFNTTTSGDQQIIYSENDNSDGPLYVGSVVLYGLPHYLGALTGGNNYPGRDIVNETSWRDSLGLSLSIGLDDPSDTFGFGLSFEVARGFNLTLTRLYKKVNRLAAGLEEGGVFTSAGGSANIPTQSGWDSELAFGLSIDSRYLVKYFQRN